MIYNPEEFDMMDLHPAEDPYRGSPHKFSRIPLPDGSPRMPSKAELENMVTNVLHNRLEAGLDEGLYTEEAFAACLNDSPKFRTLASKLTSELLGSPATTESTSEIGFGTLDNNPEKL